MLSENYFFIEKKGKYVIIGEIKGEELIQFEVFDSLDDFAVGSIIRGRVINKIEALNAYFIDIGMNRNAFLQIDERDERSYSEGEELIVQIISKAGGEKGCKITDKYEIKGKHLILTPFTSEIKFSKKINDLDYIENLKDGIKNVLGNNLGIVVRTSAYSRDNETILKELCQLLDKYNYLLNERHFSPTPKILIKGNNFTGISNFRKSVLIHTNDKDIYTDLESKCSINEVVYRKDFSIKHNSKIFAKIKSLFERRVILDNGIELIFDKTEAFNVVDINSKGYLHRKSYKTLDDVNLEAIGEIVKQIVFRNLQGIILVDLIPLKNKELKKNLLIQLEDITKKYKNPPIVVGITKLGILEMTRNSKVNSIALEKLNLDMFEETND